MLINNNPNMIGSVLKHYKHYGIKAVPVQLRNGRIYVKYFVENYWMSVDHLPRTTEYDENFYQYRYY